MVELEDLVGNLAVITTVGLFLSGLPICYEIYKKKSIGDISHIPFFCAAINTFLNFLYGYLIENDKVMIVNLIGIVLETLYVVFYYIYSSNKMTLFKQIVVSVTGCIIVYVFAFIIEEESLLATTIMGYLSCVAAVIMFASPLSNLKLVLNNKNTESLSFPLCFSTLACSTLWTIYAFMINDYFIFTPNVLGALLGAAQVSLFYKFSSK